MLELTKGALLFDCDGTITDEKFLPEMVSRTIQDVVEGHGCIYDREMFDDIFKQNKGGGFDKYYLGYLNAVDRLDILSDISLEAFSELAIAKYTQTVDAVVRGEDVGVSFKVNQDAINIIRWANEQDPHIPVAIVTNANPNILAANLRMAGIGIRGETPGAVKVDLVVHRDMYGENAALRKPHSFPYEEACNLLGVSPENSAGFEDSEVGHRSMARAGIGLRVHVCEKDPTEPVMFVKDGEHFGPDIVAPYGKLTPDFIQEAIAELNNTGNVVNLSDFNIFPSSVDEQPAPEEHLRNEHG